MWEYLHVRIVKLYPLSVVEQSNVGLMFGFWPLYSLTIYALSHIKILKLA